MSRLLTGAIVGLMATTAGMAQEAPRAAKKAHQVPSPNGAREDAYYWLRDDTRKNPEMLAYLKAENAYADAVLKPLQPLEKTLYEETLSHIKQDDTSVPYRDDGYWYQTKFATGADYPTVVRRKGTQTAPEEMLFDQPAMAKGHSFFQIGDWSEIGRAHV